MCYYDSLAESREGDGRFTIADIDPNKCTHLVYAASDIEEYELVPFCQTDTQRYWAFNDLKTRSVQGLLMFSCFYFVLVTFLIYIISNRNPMLKTLLSVGGPDHKKWATVIFFCFVPFSSFECPVWVRLEPLMLFGSVSSCSSFLTELFCPTSH